MSLVHVTFINVEKVEKPSTKTPGRINRYVKIDGFATDSTGRRSVFRYDFWPMKDQPLPDWKLGEYSPVLDLAPHWETAKLEPRIVDFTPRVLPKAA